MTALTDIKLIKALVDIGHPVYAGNTSYRVIKDSIGQYLIMYREGENYIGLHGQNNDLNMSPIFIK